MRRSELALYRVMGIPHRPRFLSQRVLKIGPKEPDGGAKTFILDDRLGKHSCLWGGRMFIWAPGCASYVLPQSQPRLPPNTKRYEPVGLCRAFPSRPGQCCLASHKLMQQARADHANAASRRTFMRSISRAAGFERSILRAGFKQARSRPPVSDDLPPPIITSSIPRPRRKDGDVPPKSRPPHPTPMPCPKPCPTQRCDCLVRGARVLLRQI
ncbi:hypothetical protein K523DRAFT_157212 [Schizophyllum commune Tattone D]|nr:hypothetical protein K523DRAFT_157212 [Schizophyllum commune Tattone D]